MNYSQQQLKPARASLPPLHLPSDLSVTLQEDMDAQTDSYSAHPALYLAWSNSQVAVALPQTFLPLDPCRDRGLWLLREKIISQERWLSLNSELLKRLPPTASRVYTAAKRAGDVVGSLTLLLLLLPLLLLTAILVRLDSPGPALFRQYRVGKDGRQFKLWKFRSMHVHSPMYARSPTSDQDQRLTRVGYLLRRISADELPQFINVLKGEMSLVGPRPEMPFIVDQYTTEQRQRLVVKPGMTGLWQVSPARAQPIHENLQYDLHYIRHQNLWLDTAILLRTVVAVVLGVGAV